MTLQTQTLSRPSDGGNSTPLKLLTTDKLVKEYRRRVVNGVSVHVSAGEIVGLLGPNGAGKTTTFNMVVGMVKPDEGAVKFLDATSRGCRCTSARGWASVI